MGLVANARKGLGFAHFLYMQRVKGFDVPDRPHFDPLSTEPFIDRLRSSKLYLEFGSGGSTVVAAQLGIETITVESDRWFGRAVQAKIHPATTNTMLFIDLGLTRDWSYPVFKRQTPARRARWDEYTEAPRRHISKLGGRFPDLILVDGRFRMACALVCAQEAHRLGQSTTICVDDYGDKDWYRPLEYSLGTPELVGRMAIFSVHPDRPAPTQDVIERAKRDFR
ncbi:hypothetical protein [Sphingomonas crocodyli]|uniref:Class I SAM-dependent methyltransferase n=1 Tax=Sphingomonas crocodyli TaxID=1979270 RepID=A0A437LXS4_9SPHN|nr:hypothetical protein [Sphingomonas crocodyli]RVT90210.1 hypothetical protein EOD43_18100 [Sphingomonas crocodyli]